MENKEDYKYYMSIIDRKYHEERGGFERCLAKANFQHEKQWSDTVRKSRIDLSKVLKSLKSGYIYSKFYNKMVGLKDKDRVSLFNKAHNLLEWDKEYQYGIFQDLDDYDLQLIEDGYKHYSTR